MNIKPLISIVIPVYNVENYLEQAIQSVMAQSYTNLQILLIDDGSTDSCPEICDRFTEIDRRIQTIHKSNGGLSDARNVGIEYAKGEYITFIDSDDFVSADYIEILYNLIHQYKVKIAACAITNYITGSTPIESGHDKQIVLNKEEAFKQIIIDGFLKTSAWGKLYKSELFKNIRFPVGQIFEDVSTTYKLFEIVPQIAFTFSGKYYYRYNPSSILNSKFSKKNLDIIPAHLEFIQFFNDHHKSLRSLARQRYARYLIAYLYRALKSKYNNSEDINLLNTELKNHIFCFLWSNNSLKKKIFALLCVIHIPFAKWLLTRNL